MPQRSAIQYVKNNDFVKISENKIPVGNSNITLKIDICAENGGNYIGETSVFYTAYINDISKVFVDKIANQTYTGAKITPGVHIYKKVGKETVDINTSDYEVKYVNNIHKGTATVYIYGKGTYGGVKKVTFRIVEKPVSWIQKIRNQYAMAEEEG